MSQFDTISIQQSSSSKFCGTMISLATGYWSNHGVTCKFPWVD